MSDDLSYIRYERRVAETEAAILFQIELENIWIPKSQIEDEDTKEKLVVIPRWLAKKKDLSSEF